MAHDCTLLSLSLRAITLLYWACKKATNWITFLRKSTHARGTILVSKFAGSGKADTYLLTVSHQSSFEQTVVRSKLCQQCCMAA